MTEVLKVHEAAEIAKVSTKTIYRALDNCELVAYKVGRAIRIDREDFDHWLRSSPAREELVQRGRVRRPRRLPTSPSALSVARMRDQDQHDEAA
jgi:excisionase family DNA binding protein